MLQKIREGLSIFFGCASLLALYGCGGGSLSDNAQQLDNPDGSGSSNVVSPVLFDGFTLEGIDTFDQSGVLLRSVAILHDFEANTDEWAESNSDGLIAFRDVGQYDENGRLAKVESFDSAGALRFTSSYAIVDDLITSRVRSNGSTMNFTYNSSGLLETKEQFDDSTGDLIQTDRFTYDAGNRVSQKTIARDSDALEFQTRVEFTHNASGQLILVERFDQQTDELQMSEQFFYGEDGNQTSRDTWDANTGLTETSLFRYTQTPIPRINLRRRYLTFFL